MEASVLSQPARPSATRVRVPLLRLQSDERLIELIRAGHEAAFEALVQRYRARLLAFCRHMLGSKEDAEDALQEVFAAAYRAICADEREILVRPWLYRIARNMSLKHLGRRRPAADGCVEELELAGGASTVDAVHLREDLRQIVCDVRELPETQRTALLLREIDGLSYEQIAVAMDTSVPGVKSLLVRARVSLAEEAEGRVLSCEVVHLELRQASEGLARLSGPARRHARHCGLCGEYQSELGLRRRLPAAAAALLPFGPAALLRSLLGRFGAGAAGGTGAGLAGGSAGGSAGAGAAGASAITAGASAGAGAAGAGGAVTATLGAVGAKAAVAVATATLVAAGAADIHHTVTRSHHHHAHAQAAHAAAPAVTAPPAPLAAGRVQPSSTTYVRAPAQPAPERHRSHHQHHSTTPAATSPSSAPADEQLPATHAGPGTFTDSAPPPSTADKPVTHTTPPTDPSTQPMGAPEPVQTQGFTSQPSAGGDSTGSSDNGSTATSGTSTSSSGTTASGSGSYTDSP